MYVVQVVSTVIYVFPIMQPFNMDNWKMSDSLVAAIGKPIEYLSSSGKILQV